MRRIALSTFSKKQVCTILHYMEDWIIFYQVPRININNVKNSLDIGFIFFLYFAIGKYVFTHDAKRRQNMRCLSCVTF